MKKRTVNFSEEQKNAIVQALQTRKKFYPNDLKGLQQTDKLIEEVQSASPELTDDEKVTIRYAISYVYFFEHEEVLMDVLSRHTQYEMLRKSPEKRPLLETFNFAFHILNKVRLRSDSKWLLVEFPE